jgi:hypothetical protein
MADDSSDQFNCRFSGRVLKNTTNCVAIGNRESEKLRTDMYNSSSGDQLNTNISERKLRPSSTSSFHYHDDDQYYLHQYENKDGSLGSCIKKKHPLYPFRGGGGDEKRKKKRRKYDTDEMMINHMDSHKDDFSAYELIHDESSTTATTIDAADATTIIEMEQEPLNDVNVSDEHEQQQQQQYQEYSQQDEDDIDGLTDGCGDCDDNEEYNSGFGGTPSTLSINNYFKEELLTNPNKSHHNNIAYWTRYYSFLNVDDYDEYESSSSSSSSTAPPTTKVDSFVHEDIQHVAFDRMVSRKTNGSNNDIDTPLSSCDPSQRYNDSFKRTLTDDVLSQIDDTMSKLLTTILFLIDDDDVDNNNNGVSTTTKLERMKKERQQKENVNKLKSYYIPIITRIIILLYNSPKLVEWEKDKNIKHQKQVKSSSLSKEAESITDLSHLEEKENDIKNSMDTILCPKKICECLMLKYFLYTYHLTDKMGNNITIWTNDLLLKYLSNNNVIDHILSKDYGKENVVCVSTVAVTTATTTTAAITTTTAATSSSPTNETGPVTNSNTSPSSQESPLRKTVNDYAKVIKLALLHYENDPIWLKSFIFS